jgi:hypothetical protein
MFFLLLAFLLPCAHGIPSGSSLALSLFKLGFFSAVSLKDIRMPFEQA